MGFRRATLDTCHLATGTVVVIDVIRAFTTAAFAFAAGARDVVITGTIEEALRLRQGIPGALTMGEVDGWPIEGFDFGNSPAALIGVDLSGRRMIQRTSAGTQGVVRSTKATQLVAASFVCAGATARYLLRNAGPEITFIPTGVGNERDGDEDAACAEYVEALMCATHPPDTAPYLRRVLDSRTGRAFADLTDLPYLAADLECCMAIDHFDFALPVARENGLLIMRPVSV
jgi:2-phosphosulfolactate phosphatase